MVAVADAPFDAHEWVSFEDPSEERTWVVDVTFLSSSWQCIYGAGCQGILTEPTPERMEGCCSYGAHFADEADAERVSAAAGTLSAEQWQFRAKGRRKTGVLKRDSKGVLMELLIMIDAARRAGESGYETHIAALICAVNMLPTVDRSSDALCTAQPSTGAFRHWSSNLRSAGNSRSAARTRSQRTGT